MLPEEYLFPMDKMKEVFNFAWDSKHFLEGLEIGPLTMTVANLTIPKTFNEIRQLSADVILECQFIDRAFVFSCRLEARSHFYVDRSYFRGS